jgi:hypothetical protein
MKRNKRGKIKYVPISIINQVECIKRTENIKKDCDAFSKLAEHARVGQEVERIYGRLNPFYKKKKK